MSQLPRSELAGILFQEIEGYLPEIDAGITLLQNSSTDQESLNEVHRLFHNIKGAASQVAFLGLSNSASICETVIAHLLDTDAHPDKPQLEFLGLVSAQIREFCSLDDKSAIAEQSLFTKSISFFKDLMIHSDIAKHIVLPEYIDTLLKTEKEPLRSQKSQATGADGELHNLRVDCLNSLRSIVPLLQELTSCSNPTDLTILPKSVLQPMMTALSTLAHCSRTAGLRSQEQLIASFLGILVRYKQNPHLTDSNTPVLLQEFLSYLDIIFSLPPAQSEIVIVTVQNHLARVVDLLSNESTFSPSVSIKHENSDLGWAEERDANSIDLEDDFLQDLMAHEQDGQNTVHFSDSEESELLNIFQTECSEHLLAITTELELLKLSNEERTDFTVELRESINRMRIRVHTLKGAAAMTGFNHIATSAYEFEKFLSWLHEDSHHLTTADISVIHSAAESLRLLSEGSSQQSIFEAENLSRALQKHLLLRIKAAPEQDADAVIFEQLISNQDSILTTEADFFPPPEEDANTPNDYQENIAFDGGLSVDFLIDISDGDIITEISDESFLETSAGPQQNSELQDEENELLAIFQSECDEHLLNINRELNILAAEVRVECDLTPQLHQSIAHMRRGFHTLKGAAAMTGFEHIATCAHAVEDLLDWLHDDARDIQPDDVSLIAEAVDTIELFSQSPKNSTLTSDNTLSDQINEHLLLRSGTLDSHPETDSQSPSQDVFEKVPEALQDDRTALPAGAGNVRVKLEDLEELVNIEGELVVTRGSIEKLLDRFSQSLHELQTIKDSLRRKSQELEVGFEAQSLYGFGPASPRSTDLSASPVNSELSEFDPIELDRYSQLNLIIRSLNEISIDVNAIHSEMMSLGSSMQGQVTRQQLAMGLMQEKLLRIRMTPLSSISSTLFRTVRQTAKILSKDVQLKVTGEDVLMDRFIWSKTIDPLMHILRNCIDHGIEDEATRISQNKPAAGQISLNATQHGRMVVLKISDDGRGIDTQSLRSKLIAEKIISASDAISDQDLLPYLFRPSVSTRDDISHISGRGVGLDIVLRNIQELRGKVQIINAPGQGVTFELNIPITLSVNRAIIIDLGSQHFAVPIQDITEVHKFRGAEILKGEKTQVIWNNTAIDLVELAPYLKLPATSEADQSTDVLTLVVDNGNEHVAIQIDRIEEQREIVIKDLGSHLRYVRGISGVTLTGEGTIIPVLNLSELSAGHEPAITPTIARVTPAVRQQKALNVLVVDDSISVRYSISRLVESQSWHVHQAIDGIDALEKLETVTPDVIVLDIEMPRMNGYEFMSVLRNSKENNAIPVIMLTSRASDKHRKKAEELGVNHYMTKPFQEDDFIQLLSTLDTNR